MTVAASKLSDKIFGIGFNKTGTSTLGKCFDILGTGPVARPQVLHDTFFGETYRYHDPNPVLTTQRKDDEHAEAAAVRPFGEYPYRTICDAVFDHQNHALALQIAINFRSFHDRPWNIGGLYKALDLAYAGSRFILTWRDPEAWWRSVESWLLVRHRDDHAKLNRYLKHIGNEAIDRDRFIDSYLAHNAAIRRYFDGRPNFLDINFEHGEGWEQLCLFLGTPIPDRPFPHENKQEYEHQKTGSSPEEAPHAAQS